MTQVRVTVLISIGVHVATLPRRSVTKLKKDFHKSGNSVPFELDISHDCSHIE